MSLDSTDRAETLLETSRRELEPVARRITSHRYLEALAESRASRDSLRVFASEQYAILRSDRRSFAQLAARFPNGVSGSFFLSMSEGEGEALEHLIVFAEALGLDEPALAAYEPRPGCQAYPAFVAWLALNGGRAEVALAFLANLEAWGVNCARALELLPERYGLGREHLAFFAFFTTPGAEFERQALAVIEEGLRAGEPPQLARRAARLLQAYELSYWDTISDELDP